MPVITLLSDLGTQSTALSSVRAFLLQAQPEFTVVDICNTIEQGNLKQASWLSLSAYSHFPKGTIHLVITDIYSCEHCKLLLAEKDGHYFITPDNGFLSLTFGTPDNTWLCKEFKGPTLKLKDWMDAANVVMNAVKHPETLSEQYHPYTPANQPRQIEPRLFHNRIQCSILHIDRFGNIVVNISQKEFAALTANSTFKVKIPGERKVNGIRYNYETAVILENYYDVEEDRLLCRFNSLGFLEISLNHGSAAARFESDTFVDKNLVNEFITIHLHPAA